MPVPTVADFDTTAANLRTLADRVDSWTVEAPPDPTPPDPPDPVPLPADKALSGFVWTDGMPGTPAYPLGLVDTIGKSCSAQARHMMGWGALNPKPWSNRAADFAANLLQSHIGRMLTTNPTLPMIVFDVCPDYMKGGGDGSTVWSPDDWFSAFPLPQYEDAFADLCASVAAFFRDVRYFVLWNENKGLWTAGGWDWVRYNRLWNKVHDKVKAVRPDALLGGPYPFCHFANPGYNGGEVDGSKVTGSFGKMDKFSQMCFEMFFRDCGGGDWWAFDCNLGCTWGGNISGDAAMDRHAAVAGWLMTLKRQPVFCMETYPSIGDSPNRYVNILDKMTLTVGKTLCGALLWGEGNEGAKHLWTGNSPTTLANTLAARRA